MAQWRRKETEFADRATMIRKGPDILPADLAQGAGYVHRLDADNDGIAREALP
jgi:hypothetical protein